MEGQVGLEPTTRALSSRKYSFIDPTEGNAQTSLDSNQNPKAYQKEYV